MAKTKIEWATDSWNPLRARDRSTNRLGWFCERVSDGCKNCYASRLNDRLGTQRDYAADKREKVNLFLDDKMLSQPLRWKAARTIFVCSMTDLFAEFVPDESIDRIFAVMALCPQHTFQVLTKRPERMREYFGHSETCQAIRDAWIEGAAQKIHHERTGVDPSEWLAVHMPLENVWLGVSCEDQKTADERIPLLLQTPAAVRFISYEPALGPVLLRKLPYKDGYFVDPLSGILFDSSNYERNRCTQDARLHWVIIGGESGPGARPFNIKWARDVIAQCKAAGVACFVKQLGAFVISDDESDWIGHKGWLEATGNGHEQRWRIVLKDRKGGDWNEWPEDLRVREYPSA